jgi:hypothetical protein
VGTQVHQAPTVGTARLSGESVGESLNGVVRLVVVKPRQAIAMEVGGKAENLLALESVLVPGVVGQQGSRFM